MLHLLLSSTVIYMLTALLNSPRLASYIQLSTHSHLYSVHLFYARINQHLRSFILSTGNLCNSLPESVFPPYYDLNSFKRRVSRHLQLYFFLLLCFLWGTGNKGGPYFTYMFFAPGRFSICIKKLYSYIITRMKRIDVPFTLNSQKQ